MPPSVPFANRPSLTLFPTPLFVVRLSRVWAADKIMEEVDRFQELQLEIEGERERQVDTRKKLLAAHERVVKVGHAARHAARCVALMSMCSVMCSSGVDVVAE